MDVLTPSWCLGPSFENQEPARGSCAKTAQAAASPWFGEGSAADYWGTAGEPFLLSGCLPNIYFIHSSVYAALPVSYFIPLLVGSMNGLLKSMEKL